MGFGREDGKYVGDPGGQATARQMQPSVTMLHRMAGTLGSQQQQSSGRPGRPGTAAAEVKEIERKARDKIENCILSNKWWLMVDSLVY